MSGRNGARRGILNNRLLLSSFYLETLPSVNISGKRHYVSAFFKVHYTVIIRSCTLKQVFNVENVVLASLG